MKHLRIQHASAFSLDSAASSFPSQPTQAEQPARQNAGFFRRLQTCSLIAATLFAGASPSMAQAPQSAQDVASTQVASPSDSDAYTTAVEYVVHFYPLWFSNQQLQVNNQLGTTNRMVAPYQVGPDFKYVVASNYDTLYSTANLDLWGRLAHCLHEYAATGQRTHRQLAAYSPGEFQHRPSGLWSPG
jgi:hypothetical protein